MACSEGDPLSEGGDQPTDEPVTPAPTDPEIFVGSKVDPYGATEGTLNDKPGNSLMAYVYKIYFGGASPNCGAGVRPYLIRRPALAHKNPTRFSRGSMSKCLLIAEHRWVFATRSFSVLFYYQRGIGIYILM